MAKSTYFTSLNIIDAEPETNLATEATFQSNVDSVVSLIVANIFNKACELRDTYTGDSYENTGTSNIPIWSLIPSSGSGITTLTGNVTAGPGTGSQAATVVGATGNFLVGGILTVTGATLLNGDVTLGNAGTDTLYTTAKLGSQLYANVTSGAFTLLKMHNHLTTAEVGSLEAKGEFVNTTGSLNGITSEYAYTPTGATGTPDVVRAGLGSLTLTAANTITSGQIVGLLGQTIASGILNGAAVTEVGVLGAVNGTGAKTLVAHVAGVASSVGAGVVNPTTGKLSSFLAGNLGTTVIDNVLTVVQGQFTTNLLDVDVTTGCVDVTQTGNGGFISNSKGTFTQVGQLRIVIAGNTYYIPFGTVA